MACVRGRFGESPEDADDLAEGLVQARVALFYPVREIDIQFQIDTGCRDILLVDEDFLDAAWCFGEAKGQIPDGRPRSDLSLADRVVEWIRTHKDAFVPVERSIVTIGGEVENVFMIKDAFARLCNDGCTPSRRAIPWSPIYGTFSAGFRPGSRRTSFKSLLGREVLNRIRVLSWRGRGRKIRLCGISRLWAKCAGTDT
jgi:hypothetical protein